MDITPIEVVQKYFNDYKQKNGEINLKNCPFCGPNQKSDNQWKFYINAESGAYQCKRAKKCGEKGSFYDLLKFLGADEYIDNYSKDYNKETTKTYDKPDTNVSEFTGKAKKYLKKRGIFEVVNDLPVTMTGKEHEYPGVIAFEYYEEGEVVLHKYRKPKKNGGYWCSSNGKPVLWNLENCNSDKPLLFTEGEMDSMAVYKSGFENVVSLPFGAQDYNFLEYCWEKLENFDEIILWMDNDKAGKETEKELIKRFGEGRCSTVNVEYNDANLMLFKESEEKVLEAVEQAEPVPITSVVDLSTVESIDYTKIESVKSSVPKINKYLGGYELGVVTVWTGVNGSGKSTFLGQEMIESIDNGYPVGIYSDELTDNKLQKWINLQIAGPEHVELMEHEIKQDLVSSIPKDKEEKIKKWYENKIWSYNNRNSSNPEDILNTFKNLYRRYGVKVFLIDNLMTVQYGGSRSEYYHRQSQFLKKIIKFAKGYNVHVHVVAHPNKTEGRINKMNIAGLTEITNQPDNVVAVNRAKMKNIKTFPGFISEKFKEINKNNDREEYEDLTIIEILKSRLYGKEDILIVCRFEGLSKRIYQSNNDDFKLKEYDWK